MILSAHLKKKKKKKKTTIKQKQNNNNNKKKNLNDNQLYKVLQTGNNNCIT